MTLSIEMPWNRYGLIAELAHQLECASPQFERTALQKMVYLLKELFSVNAGYEFELYTYGPFSSQLLADLDLAALLGGVSVEYVPSLVGGYRITSGPQNEEFRRRAAVFLEAVDPAIKQAVRDFGSFSAKDLELRSTIVYVDRDSKRSGQRPSRAAFIGLVKELKPRFSLEAIDRALADLESHEYLERRV